MQRVTHEPNLDGRSSPWRDRKPEMRRCLIFNPYLGVLGGGERYTFALGQVIAETYDVTYATQHGQIPQPEAMRRLGFPDVTISPLAEHDLSRTSLAYDLAVAIGIKPPPPLWAAKNLFIIQFPFEPLQKTPFARRRTQCHLRRYERLVYSEFARRWVLERWGVDADVLAPAADIPSGDVPRKENLILSVGRFFADKHCKRQDALVDAFARLPDELQRKWHLVLVGGFSGLPQDAAFVERVRRAANGLNVSIELNASAARLAALQERARFFWHATGFGRPSDAPELAEHFGLSTIEAMGHGAIPLVFADGGQIEVVTPAVGVLWTSIEQLVDETVLLMGSAPSDLDQRARAAHLASQSFSVKRFNEAARRIVRRSEAERQLKLTTRRALAAVTAGNSRFVSATNRVARAMRRGSTY